MWGDTTFSGRGRRGGRRERRSEVTCKTLDSLRGCPYACRFHLGQLLLFGCLDCGVDKENRGADDSHSSPQLNTYRRADADKTRIRATRGCFAYGSGRTTSTVGTSPGSDSCSGKLNGTSAASGR